MNIANVLNSLEASGSNTAIFGVTKFSDLTKQEFRSKHLGAFNETTNPKSRNDTNTIISRRTSEIAISALALSPVLTDWTGIYTTPVRDQGNCELNQYMSVVLSH